MVADDPGAMVRGKFSLIVSIFVMKHPRIIIILMMSVIAIPLPVMGQDVRATNCGDPYDSADSGGIGPYNLYDQSIPEKIDIVVRLHFTPYMEEVAVNGSTSRKAVTAEERGGGESRVAANLDYTLRAIPNHARALYAMGMFQLRLREQSNLEATWEYKTAECYFERAIMYTPDDGQVYLAYAMFRHKQGQPELALKNYQEALQIMPNAVDAHYSVGLLYVQMKEFELARQHAWKAYEMGYPLPGLRNALQRRGEWQPVPAVTQDPAP